MVIDDKFYVGGARDRQIIRMVRGIRRFHRVKYVPGVFVITLPLFGDGILEIDRKSTRLNSSHMSESRMPSSA